MLACHNALGTLLTAFCHEAGYHVRREAYVSQLLRQDGSAAVLDVVAYPLGQAVPILACDITVRHPFAQRYMSVASSTRADAPGHAAAQGAADKLRSYRASGGVHVTPFAVEPYGRMHGEAYSTLATLTDLAVTRARVFNGSQVAPSVLLRRWLAELQCCLAKQSAHAIASALSKEQHLTSLLPLRLEHGSVAAAGEVAPLLQLSGDREVSGWQPQLGTVVQGIAVQGARCAGAARIVPL